MKRIIVLFLAVVLLYCFTACGTAVNGINGTWTGMKTISNHKGGVPPSCVFSLTLDKSGVGSMSIVYSSNDGMYTVTFDAAEIDNNRIKFKYVGFENLEGININSYSNAEFIADYSIKDGKLTLTLGEIKSGATSINECFPVTFAQGSINI